ncbi:hypothetical protein CB1_000274014 [Camelus ferus]|nr:hypothetical protein CB1_000274014 [Camelus ferus]
MGRQARTSRSRVWLGPRLHLTLERSHHLCPTVSQAEQDGAGAVSTAGPVHELSPPHFPQTGPFLPNPSPRPCYGSELSLPHARIHVLDGSSGQGHPDSMRGARTHGWDLAEELGNPRSQLLGATALQMILEFSGLRTGKDTLPADQTLPSECTDHIPVICVLVPSSCPVRPSLLAVPHLCPGKSLPALEDDLQASDQTVHFPSSSGTGNRFWELQGQRGSSAPGQRGEELDPVCQSCKKC